MSDSGDRTPPARAPDPAARLERLARWAALAALWERVWPPLAWAGSTVALFLAISWFGLWFAAPPWARLAGLLVFAAALLAGLRPLLRLRAPPRRERLARLDRDSGLAHGAASGFEDTLANASGDATTQAMWTLHRARLAREIERLRVAAPEPRMAWRDPRALRYAALMLAIVGAMFAGSERYARVAAAFDWNLTAASAAPPRVDAWIDPPGYTGKPPILLKVAGQEAPETVAAPEDSALVVRSEARDVEVRVEGAITAPPAAKDAPPSPEHRFALHGDGKATIARGGSTLATYVFKVTPSGRPTIALLDPPEHNFSGSLTLHYAIHDAYGVASAEADFALPGETKPVHRLVEPPKLPLSLPGGPSGIGDARTTGDLASHGWAGESVVMTLHATDVAGHTGDSEAIPVTLPQRQFSNPLAKALVEQRRHLIIDPDANRPHVARALDAFLLAPDQFGTAAPVYLGLRMAQTKLAAARSDPELLEVADLLWAMALQIEDGDASKTLHDLRAAEQQLRDALKRGASEDEIKALTQQLRELAEKYLSELAQRDPAAAEDESADSRDVDEMMDRMADAARNGSREDAQAMLDQLQDLLENMRGAEDPKAEAAERELRKQLGEIEKLLRDQQALRDDTFKRGQARPQGPGIPDFLGEPNGGDNGDERPPQGMDKREQANPFGKNDDNGAPSLQDRQKALRDRLAELQKKLKQFGLKGEKGFDDAEGAMSEAERDLKGEGEGPPQAGDGSPGGKGGQALGDAVQAQGRALEALRGGMQGLQKQMQGSGGQKGNRVVRRRDGRSPGKDPFGRESGSPRGASEGSLHEGQAPAERARRVVEELRRRLADPNRPSEERDYLERLLGSH